ncbi:MAG: vWA domain-containing protein [Flavobacteriales bacterium]
MNFSFLYPQFLWAFALLAIPVAIHLFNFRKYKELHFPNTLFLKSIKEQSKAANRLKNLLILLLRMLAFSFLILAFALPFSSRGDVKNNQSSIHAFYIDNSFSMNSASEGGRLLEEAKKKAESLVKNLPNSDYFLLTTNDFEGKHRRHLDKKTFLEELNLVDESPHSRTLSEIYLRQQSDLGEENAELYWLSDFQKGMNDFNKKKIDSLSTLFIIPIEASVKNNVSIDSCWFDSPVRKTQSPEEIKIKITNHGDKNLENITVRLSINNEQKAFASVNLKSEKSEIVALTYSVPEPQLINGTIEIEDSPILFDNTFYFSYDIRKKTNVLQISEKIANSSFYKLFKNDSSVVFSQQNINQLDYSELKENDLIVLDELQNYSSGLAQELLKFTQNGGSILFIPSKNNNFSTLTTTLQIDELSTWDSSSIALSRFNTQIEFFNNVFAKKDLPENEKLNLPTLKGHYKINNNFISGKEILLPFQNNDPYLVRYQKGNSAVYVLSSPLANFAQHWLFPTVMYRIIFTSISSDVLFQSIHQNLQIPLKNKDNTGSAQYILSNNKNEYALNFSKTGDQSFLFSSSNIEQAGIYNLLKDKKVFDAVALNYSRQESDMHLMDDDDFKNTFGESKNIHVISTSELKASASAADLLSKKEHWKHFIVAALLMLLAEVLVIRFWKN